MRVKIKQKMPTHSNVLGNTNAKIFAKSRQMDHFEPGYWFEIFIYFLINSKKNSLGALIGITVPPPYGHKSAGAALAWTADPSRKRRSLGAYVNCGTLPPPPANTPPLAVYKLLGAWCREWCRCCWLWWRRCWRWKWSWWWSAGDATAFWRLDKIEWAAVSSCWSAMVGGEKIALIAWLCRCCSMCRECLKNKVVALCLSRDRKFFFNF